MLQAILTVIVGTLLYLGFSALVSKIGQKKNSQGQK